MYRKRERSAQGARNLTSAANQPHSETGSDLIATERFVTATEVYVSPEMACLIKCDCPVATGRHVNTSAATTRLPSPVFQMLAVLALPKGRAHGSSLK
jgi:hypothetical protein